MAKYKGITFAKGYNRSFADFKDEFGSTHVFKRLKPQVKEKELRAAYKIATNGNITSTKAKSTTAKRKRSKRSDI